MIDEKQCDCEECPCEHCGQEQPEMPAMIPGEMVTLNVQDEDGNEMLVNLIQVINNFMAILHHMDERLGKIEGAQKDSRIILPEDL